MKKNSLLVALCLVFAFQAGAQVKFRYDLGLDYLFNNMEYDRSNNRFEQSGTVHGVRLAPVVGAGFVSHEGKVNHSLMLGVDMMVEMGSQLKISDAFRELIVYYGADATLSNGGCFSAKAGVFPRAKLKGNYIGTVMDENFWFRDSNVEGLLFQYDASKVNAELGLDWMGLFADGSHPERRERFRIFTSGSWNFAGPFSFGWTGNYYHFACSLIEQNVVDNHLFQAWLGWKPSVSWLDILNFELGGVVTYQRDRAVEKSLKTPGGLLFSQTLSRWNVYLENTFYYGADLMPMYDQYGSDLYQGRASFHTRFDTASCVDRFAVSYMPRIAGSVKVFVTAAFNFGSSSETLDIPFYRGCQQILGIRVDLNNEK